MRVFGLIVVSILILLMPSVLQADDHGDIAGDVDRLAMYRVYHGQWDSVTQTRITSGEQPIEFETKAQFSQREILDGAMIEVRGVGEMDGKPYQYMLLYGYSVAEEVHACWFHDQRGVHFKLDGKWSEDDKTMTWTLAGESPDGTSITIVDDLSERDRISYTFRLEAEDGTVLMTQAGSATRSKKDD